MFLLLVFFMVTAKPIKQESDISIGLPGTVSQEESVDIPDEQRIAIVQDRRADRAQRTAAGFSGQRRITGLVATQKAFR